MARCTNEQRYRSDGGRLASGAAFIQAERMKIIWDEPKRLATLAGRGLDFAIVTEAFFASAKVVAAKRGRFMAVGHIERRAFVVVFQPVGTEAVTLISLRPASRKERSIL